MIAPAVVAGMMPLLLLLPLTLTCHVTELCGDLVAQIFSPEVGEYEVAMTLGLDEISAVAGPTVTLISACVMTYAVQYMFQAQSFVSGIVAVVGASTALFGSAGALAQLNVKRLPAYASISQIGLMVLAVGVGAPWVAMALFIIHAIFKLMLFLAAGRRARCFQTGKVRDHILALTIGVATLLILAWGRL